jgi:hypothetical protein
VNNGNTDKVIAGLFALLAIFSIPVGIWVLVGILMKVLEWINR